MFVWKIKFKYPANPLYRVKKIKTLWFLGIIPLFISITEMQ